MTFKESVNVCFRKCTDFNGRASLSEFWWFWLFWLLVSLGVFVGISIVGYLIGGIYGLLAAVDFYLVFGVMPFGIINFLLMLAVTIRRLHDTNHSGVWDFIVFVPIIGSFWLLFLLLSSNNDENRYGLPEY